MPVIQHEPVPVISVGGPPRERGRQHGELLRGRIGLAVDRYMERFRHFASLTRSEAHEEARRYMPAIEGYDAEILDEIRGVADGCELPFEDILAINCRSELMFGAARIMECSSFALQPTVTADGHTYVGQNWDWAPDIVETLAIVVIDQPPKPTVFLLDEAGIVGRMGFNSAGVGLCTNTLIADQGRPDGVPYNALLRGVLNTTRIADAIGALIRPSRAICSNYVIGDAGGQAIDVELAPDQFDYIAPVDGIVTHGNHFAGPRIRVRDRSVEKWPDSLYRECRLRERLAAHAPTITVDHMTEALKDTFGHPDAINRSADPRLGRFDQLQTVASIVIDCVDQECWIAAGPPDQEPFCHYSLGGSPPGAEVTRGQVVERERFTRAGHGK
jgi:isopenicillin-N N-acyltransferase like protein